MPQPLQSFLRTFNPLPAGLPNGGAPTMTEKPIDLDARRGMAAQKATDLRRLLSEVEANEKFLHERQLWRLRAYNKVFTKNSFKLLWYFL